MTRDDDGTELSRALAAARAAADLRQIPVATHTGISQARLSRIERGKSLPTEDEVRALARLYRLDPGRRDELLVMARDARAGIRDSRLVVQRGDTLALQQRWRRIERDARVVRSYQPALVIGAVQTAAYAAVALGTSPDAPVVADRQRRRARLFAEPQRRHLLVHTEGALRQTVGSAEVMAEQWAALAAAGEVPNVELGVIPAEHPLSFTAGTGFHLYEGERGTVAVVGLEVAAAQLTDPRDVAEFLDLWERLWEAAVVGDDAVAFIRSLAP
ncbi:MAG TPA: helix-turn-helix transcriptional regulator [Pseudonocardia sp.]|nr:helix-turn-helix transcriptional regulator [Pseudonocardia sp.]